MASTFNQTPEERVSVRGADIGSDRAVRSCSDQCAFIKNARRQSERGCEYFIRREVTYGQPCKYDLEMINNFVTAHKSGDMDTVKSTVGAIVASMFLKLQEMLQIISEQGLVQKEPILDGKGNPIRYEDGSMATRFVEHPLLTKVTSMAKAIGFDLSKFKLTPSSVSEAPKVQGNIMLHAAGNVDISLIMEQQAAMLKRFEDGAAEAEKDLAKDPVYIEMKKGNQE